MSRPEFCGRLVGRRAGYSLVEVLVATTISLIMLGAVIAAFASVMGQMTETRAVLETIDQLRTAGDLLRKDLQGLTVVPTPPVDPDDQLGYFEWTEGPAGTAAVAPGPPEYPWGLRAYNLLDEDPNKPAGVPPYEDDSTVGDLDDMLMFTTRREGSPFVGRATDPNGNRIEITSQVAEVAWFVRGNRLYRRVLLVMPEILRIADADGDGRLGLNEWGGPNAGNYFAAFDVAVRWEFDTQLNQMFLVPCTLGDLTKPENRYAHQVGGYPFHPHRVGTWRILGLPTTSESSSNMAAVNWIAGGTLPAVPLSARNTGNPGDSVNLFDAWTNPYPFAELDPLTGEHTAMQGVRVEEDLVLTNVLSFDVKGWDPQAPVFYRNGRLLKPGDPGYRAAWTAWDSAGRPAAQVAARGAYVNLNYAGAASGMPGRYDLAGPPLPQSGLSNVFVYDTFSTHYEKDGIDQFGDGRIDWGTDDFDNDGNGRVDDLAEWETLPPYPVPLRGIQITLRVFEPDSRQVRQVTITQDLLPK
ncbi:hypothetical protein JCM19992_09040 [Thermostilla marina]